MQRSLTRKDSHFPPRRVFHLRASFALVPSPFILHGEFPSPLTRDSSLRIDYSSRRMTLLLVLVAAAAGVSVALQGQFMGAMDRAVGTATSVLVTYSVGASLALIIWLARRPGGFEFRQIPWYSWFAGVTGLVIVSGIGYAAPRLGLARTLVISVAAQLIIALVIEHFGLFQSARRHFELDRAIGLTLVVAGVWLVLKR